MSARHFAISEKGSSQDGYIQNYCLNLAVGHQNKRRNETGCQGGCNKYDLKPVSFYFHLPKLKREEEFFSNIDKELDFVAGLDAKLLAFVPGTAHLARGNCDPVEVIRRYSGRVRFAHFKDIKGPETDMTESLGMEVFGDFCELGTGIVDFLLNNW